MAIVEYIKEKNQHISVMKKVIDYCVQDFKVYDEKSKQRLVSGINCNGENAFNEFMLTKNSYKKTTGMNFYQYVQSYSADEKLTPKKAHQIAMEFAEKAWQGYEVLVATHSETKNIHSHFIVNSVSFENGLKLRQNPNTLVSLRKLSDELCKKHKLSTLEPYVKDGKKMSTREFRVNQKGMSWKQKLINEIELAMQSSTTKEEFISKIKADGYDITWTDERKYITYQTPTGMKCRDIKIHDSKFLKENMELEFQFRSGQDDSNVVTGWENSRNDFKKYASENKSTYTPTTNIAGAVGSLANSASKIVDEPEDEEERRKRIEAEENGSNIGAVLGTAIGMAVALSNTKEEKPHQYTEEISKDYLYQGYDEDYYDDETEDEDEEFSMSM